MANTPASLKVPQATMPNISTAPLNTKRKIVCFSGRMTLILLREGNTD